MGFRVERRDPGSLGLPLEELAGWLDAMGPVAIVALETTGPPESRSAEIVELGVVLLEPGSPTLGVASSLARPSRSIPSRFTRLTGLVDGDVSAAPPLTALREAVAESLTGRTLITHQPDFERRFLARDVDSRLASARCLDGQEILALTHPDAPDLRLETFTRRLLEREERHRAFEDALDVAAVLAAIARGARAGEARYVEARRILERLLPDSPWLPLLVPVDRAATGPGGFADFARRAAAAAEPTPSDVRRFVEIGPSEEAPVPFEPAAIEAALADAERGERHFPGYRVRQEQIDLAREFVHVLRDGGVARLEGGTGVGKSLAYLAAAIPFAIERARAGAREPVLVSTRTKLLQDQLLRKDIAAAARFLGYSELRALSIKGRANYVCERRLSAVLGEALDPGLQAELRADYALLEACARIRPQGEIGTLPPVLARRQPRLRELLRASVAARAEQCTREQCARERRCPFGRHRRALASAHLVVANHDLLLRWPPDYPGFAHAIMDEGHEVGGVAEEVYALRVRPEDVAERLDELFGAPARPGRGRYASRGLVAASESRSDEATLRQGRRDLMLELIGLGRAMSARADAFGGTELPVDAARVHPEAVGLAETAALRLEGLAARALRAGPAPRFEPPAPDAPPDRPRTRDLDAEEDAERQITAHVEALQSAAHGLRTAFAPDQDEFVGAFETLESPHDRWSLVLRPVAPGEPFRAEFLSRLESLAIVSATLFVAGDAHAALGEIGLGELDAGEVFSRSVGSPFPYDRAMRVVALEAEAGADPVEQTARVLATLALGLGGRTLGLFTSLARMRAVAERLSERVADEGIEVLLPQRASDDPGGLVERFRRSRRGAVLLGARRFWQGIDVRGEGLQAVVIEKLPFDVPTELLRRRDERLRAQGIDPFSRAAVGRMLLHLKQMAGRLIRSESDRGLVVIVDSRRDRGYFRRLGEAFPEGVKIELAPCEELPRIARELGLGPGTPASPGDRGSRIDES